MMVTDSRTAGDLRMAYRMVREQSETLCEPLEIEDYCSQPIAEVSPPKWHLAHTTWFFETFILKPLSEYRPFNDEYEYLFNSYYNSVGRQFPREARGTLSRPTVRTIYDYRKYVDEAIMKTLGDLESREIHRRLELGLHHEQQHQELILTDLKYILGKNPLKPLYRDKKHVVKNPDSVPIRFVPLEERVVDVGTDPTHITFCFDNETPKHKVLLAPYEISDRLVTNGEYREFIEDGGYDNHSLWLSDGWQEKQAQNWFAPEYWQKRDDEWWEYTLHGFHPIDFSSPVTHVNMYEADAYARWAGARLATEFEWENAVNSSEGIRPCHRIDGEAMHPLPDDREGTIRQLIGDCWEWTSSSYLPYPGFMPLGGALGEYNGKFMANQFVLRGGSCATPTGHIRSTYRNFFYPRDRWQFTGVRLARSV